MTEFPPPGSTDDQPTATPSRRIVWLLGLQATLLVVLVLGVAVLVSQFRQWGRALDDLRGEVTALREQHRRFEQTLADLEQRSDRLATDLQAIAAARGGASTPTPLPPVRAPALDSVVPLPRQGRTLGDPAAPVHVVIWGDYQCPACASFERQAFPVLLERYIVPGTVRWEFRNLAFIGPESLRAAEAAACAEEQGKFWEYHIGLYANFVGANRGGYADQRLLDLAAQLGLETEAFRSCLVGGRHRERVRTEVEQALHAGVQATPSFSVNGSPPFTITRLDDLIARIEEEVR
ncbi:MAG: thioredoxin domain-containing protein [Thermomicrobium sp.]|nr:thioredoxin domain-containing protein [Thermomicrobium sp.]